MFYRVKQFIAAITARITKEDVDFVRTYLSQSERALFFRLKPYEQRHCIEVANKLKKMAHNDREMIRLGLLHDVGKTVYPLNPIEKSIIVVLDHVSKGKIKKYSKCKMVKCYYEHPQIGYHLMKKQGDYDEAFLNKIKKHHEKDVEDVGVCLLQQADKLS